MKSLKKDKYIMRRYDLTGSMKQSVSPFLMRDEEFTYLRNVSYDEVGSLSKDGGYTQVGADLDTSGSGDLMHTYLDNTGAFKALVITNGKLFGSTGTPIEWEELDSSTFTVDAKCTAENREGLAYIVNELDGLHYTNGISVTSVSEDNGDIDILGRYMTVLGNEIFVANLSGTHSANDVVYTLAGSNTFYDPTEEDHDTYTTTSLKFSAKDPITGIKAFQGVIFYWTENEMYMFNPENLEVKVIASIGCTSHDSIQEINGVLYWVNRDGVFRFNGSTLPELISIPITNWAINSLWRVIDGVMWNSVAAVSFEGKYMLYVGDLTGTLPGDSGTLSDVVLTYDTYRDVWYFLTDYPVSTFTRFINGQGNLRLLFTSKDEAKVYQKDFSYKADGSPINMVVRTKYFSFDMPENEKQLEDLLITMRPSGGEGYYLTIKMAKNGTNYYEEYVTDSTPTKVELDAVSGTEFQLSKVTMKGVRVRTASYEFSNDDSGINMTLLGYTQQYKYLNNNMNLTV